VAKLSHIYPDDGDFSCDFADVYSEVNDGTLTITSVPGPTAIAMMIGGLPLFVGMAMCRGRKLQRHQA
jgi:hypothetical protein